MPFNGGFTFANFLADLLTLFLFVAWFWLLISVFRDLFRRHDVSGWMKALWVLVVIVAPYLGVFIYLITQGRGMADRNLQEVQHGREELKRMVGFSVADELEKLERLKSSGAITGEEYARLRARLVE